MDRKRSGRSKSRGRGGGGDKQLASQPPISEDPHLWTTKDVYGWLVNDSASAPGNSGAVSEHCAEALFEQAVCGNVLLELCENDLRQPPLQLSLLGDIKRLNTKIAALIDGWCVGPVRSPHCKHRAAFCNGVPSSSVSASPTINGLNSTSAGFDSLDGSDEQLNSNGVAANAPLKHEFFKTFVAFVYVFCVFLITAFVMTVVHDRVPDMKKYPPLPDIFLDNVPYIPWAFEASEFTITLLSTSFFIIVAFHKHRLVILRRFFALTGTVFILRSVTMLITSLSVPGEHLQCEPKQFDTLWSKIQRAAVIWRGLGMSAAGVRVCGDYMFSGHTVCLTILSSFISEYTPPKYYFLHTVSWVLSAFGIFFILAGHEHYSIDVFVALYLTSRLFMYYHTLARSKVLHSFKTQIWFPMFAYLEANCTGDLPYEYEFVLSPFYEWCKAKIRGFSEKSRNVGKSD